MDSPPSSDSSTASTSSEDLFFGLEEESIGSFEEDTGRNLIVYIPPNITESELEVIFRSEGVVENVKIARKKPEGYNLGYAFVKYASVADAQRAICRLNGYRVQDKVLKVSLAQPSSSNDSKDTHISISGLPRTMTEAHLYETFSNFGQIINCKIIPDCEGKSRGVVRYSTRHEAVSAAKHLGKHILPGTNTPLQVKLGLGDKPSSNRSSRNAMYDEVNKLLSMYKILFADNNNRSKGGETESPCPSSPESPARSDILFGNEAPGTGEEGVGSNLIVNYIPPNMTEDELETIFSSEGVVEKVKIVRKKPEGHSLGYAFVKYASVTDAQRAICRLNGYRVQNKVLKVSLARPSSPEIKDANLYISGIPKYLTQAHLYGTFSMFGQIINCKIIADSNGRSRGIGFVRYNTRSEALNAVKHLSKHVLPGATVPLQVKLAEKPSHRNARSSMYEEINKLLSSYKLDPHYKIDPSVSAILAQYYPSLIEEMEARELEAREPADSVCLYVYNLPSDTTNDSLYALFQRFGEIISVRPMMHYPTNQCKGYGFVNMRSEAAALRAIHHLQGQIVKGKPLQVSFKKR